jgi:cytochrome b561
MALLCWEEYTRVEGSSHPAEERRANRWPWALGLFLSLGLAVTTHYYGFLVAIPLGVAECVRTWENRRVDPWVWGALVLAVLPLPFHRGLVQHTLTHFASGAWWSPYETSIMELYNSLLGSGMKAGILLLLVVAMRDWIENPKTEKDSAAAPRPFEKPRYSQAALWIFVLALPIAGYALAVAVTGAIVNRYVLPTTLGMAVAFAVLGYRLCRRSTLAGILLVVLLGGQVLMISLRDLRGVSEVRPGRRKFPEVAFANRDGLPLVVSEAFTFLDWYNAAPPRVPPRVFLVGGYRSESGELSGIETVLQKGAKVFGWSAQTWKDFTGVQRAFLVVSRKKTVHFDSWNSAPTNDLVLLKAVEEHGTVQLLKVEGDYTLHLVQLPPAAR